MKSPAVGVCLNIEPLMDNLIFISLVLVYRICNLSYKFQVVQFLHMSLSVFSGIALL